MNKKFRLKIEYIPKILLNNKREIVKCNDSQMIVLMGFFIILGVISLSVISANLSGVGTEVSQVHAVGLLPEMINVKEKFGTALGIYFNVDEDMGNAFKFANENLSYIELMHGFYFNATLNSYGYSGHTEYGAVYHASVSLYLDDGYTNISRDCVYMVPLFV